MGRWGPKRDGEISWMAIVEFSPAVGPIVTRGFPPPRPLNVRPKLQNVRSAHLKPNVPSDIGRKSKEYKE